MWGVDLSLTSNNDSYRLPLDLNANWWRIMERDHWACYFRVSMTQIRCRSMALWLRPGSCPKQTYFTFSLASCWVLFTTAILFIILSSIQNALLLCATTVLWFGNDTSYCISCYSMSRRNKFIHGYPSGRTVAYHMTPCCQHLAANQGFCNLLLPSHNPDNGSG